MIGKLLAGAGLAARFRCVATVIAELILAAYFGRAWQLNRPKLIQMLAIAQGVDLAALRQQARGDAAEEPSTEQASYSQVLEARAMKTRNLELREQSLRSALAHVGAEQRQLAEEKKRLQKLREGLPERRGRAWRRAPSPAAARTPAARWRPSSRSRPRSCWCKCSNRRKWTRWRFCWTG